MGCLRVLAFIGGVVLLFPGACFLILGGSVRGSDAVAAESIGLVILIVAVCLFWLGFKLETPRKDRRSDNEPPESSG
jgi:hypothetical protein